MAAFSICFFVWCDAGRGARPGPASKFMSSVRHADFIAAIGILIDQPGLDGPINISSPSPLPNRDFMRDLRGAWARAPAFPLLTGC